MSTGSGCLQQLVSKGAQDLSLNVEAEFNIFKWKAEKVQRYAHEWRTFDLEENHDGGFRFRIRRHADLVSAVNAIVFVESFYHPLLFPGIPDAFRENRDLFVQGLLILSQQRDLFGEKRASEKIHMELDYAKLRIGNTCVGRLYGDWETFKGNGPEFKRDVSFYDPNTDTVLYGMMARIPLRFNHLGKDGSQDNLPLISLQYHETEVQVRFTANSSILKAYLEINYIYLDTAERRHWATNPHTFPSKQCFLSKLDVSLHEDGWIKQRIYLNHPTSVIGFRLLDEENQVVSWRDFLYIRFRLNNNIRMEGQPHQFYCSSFSDHPFMPQEQESKNGFFLFKFDAPLRHGRSDLLPHGTVNLSRIDACQIEIKLKDRTIGKGMKMRVFQECYNVLQVMAGMAALQFGS